MSQDITKQVITDGEYNKITEVVIFVNQAYIKRQVMAYIPQAGLNRLFIELNAFTVDADSVQVRVYGDGEILGVQYKEIPVLAEEITQTDVVTLRHAQQKLEQQKRILEYKQRNCLQQKQFLDSMVSFSRARFPVVSAEPGKAQAPTTYWSTQELQATLENTESMLTLLSHNYTAILKEEDGYIDDLQKINEQLSVVKNKLNLATPGVASTRKTIEIVFKSTIVQEVRIEVTYITPHATWKPFYKVDVGMDLNQVAITMFAHIEQTSGENWQGVQLSVSNAMPIAGTRLPELYSLRLSTSTSSYNNDYARILTKKSIQPEETSFLSAFDPDNISDNILETNTVDPIAEADVYIAYGRYQQAEELLHQVLKDDPNNEIYKAKLTEIAAILNPSLATTSPPKPADTPKVATAAKFSQAQEIKSSVAFEYQIPLPIDINSGGGETLLPMFSGNMEGSFFYYTVPKQDPLVYLVYEANLADAVLLSGQLNIHFGGRFVGNTFLNEKKAGEGLLLNLGAVRDVKIQRKKITDKVIESLISGMMDRFSVVRKLEFRIVVENLQATPIQVKILDAIPIAVTDRIQVKNVVLKPEPEITDWQKRKGVMRWSLALAAKETKEIYIEYLVKHPKNYIPELV